jgi:uncharacterized protein (TIGR04141 family)
MASRESWTYQSTLHRLRDVEPDTEAMFEALGEERIDKLIERGADYSNADVDGCPALVFYGQDGEHEPRWINEVRTTTGLPLELRDQRSFALLMLAVDGEVYALGYGGGHHFIPGEYKDARFGLSFAARVADPENVRDLLRKRPGQRGRVDGTWAAGGIPVWMIQVDRQSDVVSKLGAVALDLDLTASRNGSRSVRFEGGTGLRARLGVSPEDLVRDIRAIAAAIRDKQPIPELAFVDHMAGVSDRTVLELLDIELDELLSSQKKAQAGLAVSVPEESLEDYRDARSVDIKIGSAPVFGVPEVTVEAIAARTSVQQPGTRVGALREGRIQLYADPYREERLSSANALKWIETTISLDERRYHLLDGEWLEFDGVYADGQDDLIKELMDGSGGIDLPAWQRGWREDEYLVFAAARTRMPCLDRKLVTTGDGRKFEACDLLGPGDELVHVKQVGSSKLLSHLFNQGLVSAAELHYSSGARREFADLVRKHGGGRTVPKDFVPKKVVFAFRRTDGKPLSVGTLYPFSKITLAAVARRLRDMGVGVEVIGIDTAVD